MVETNTTTAAVTAVSIEITHSGELFSHVVHTFLRIHDSQVRPITHEDGVHLVVDDDPYAEHATAIFVLLHQLLRTVDRLGDDILARGCGNPESDIPRTLADGLGDTNHVVEEMRGVEVGILPVFQPFRHLELHDAVERERHQFHVLLP